MTTFLHIASLSAWQDAQRMGRYEHPSLSSEGFIHCSTSAQLQGTLERHFKTHRGLVVLTIDAHKLTSNVLWEPARGEMYPHVYGPIDLAAITRVEPAPSPWGGSADSLG